MGCLAAGYLTVLLQFLPHYSLCVDCLSVEVRGCKLTLEMFLKH